ncbi:MAG: hypothetical protein GQ535_16960 [Rhodobacteraceae bacterium]|nr:hypothetical protein [Paracoccaceae bacterium]
MKKLYLTTALTLIASPTLADITPEELWQSWQDTYSHFGTGLSAGSQSREGAVLVLQDVSTTINLGIFEIEQVISEMQLEALGDGTVSVTFDSNLTGTLTFTLEDAPSQSATMTGHIEGTSGIVTGSANDFVYELAIGQIQMGTTITMGTEDSFQSTTTSNAITTGFNGRIHYSTSNVGMNLSYSFTLDGVNNTQDSVNTVGGEAGGFKQSQRTLAEGYSGEITLFMPTPNPEAASGSLIPEGFTMDVQLGIEHMNISQKTASPYFNMDMEMDQQDMGISLTVDGQNIGLATSGQETSVTVAMPQLGPQPYRTDFENTAFAFSVPYRVSDAPQMSSLALRLGRVTVSDNIWALADPENTLSRAPADFAIAADFSSTLLLDWTNIEAVKAWEGAPALLHKITLETFLVAFENAKLEGAGAVDFSNETEVPMPSGGALSFSLTGIPALLEKLGGLPLVDPSIIAQANGVLGIFTKENDSGARVSDIEFGPEGQVFVNGLQLQ